MSAASGTARTGKPGDGTDCHNRTAPHAPAPVSPQPHHRAEWAGHLKDASGAATRPGSARSLTWPAPSPRTWQLRGTGEASHARPTPAETPINHPIDKIPLLQG